MLRLITKWAMWKITFFADFSALKNELLLGTGFGLDLVTAYDIMASFEYTYNRLKAWDFFITIGFSYDL